MYFNKDFETKFMQNKFDFNKYNQKAERKNGKKIQSLV